VTVYLVGAGPGDPGLMTVRGAQMLADADLVVYDRLSVAALLDLVAADAERINVGKQPGAASVPQAEINRILVEAGLEGRHVVRLKGGDPFVFARGGEEAAALIDAGVDVEVVPGITSAIAAPAYAGIPVTLRHSSTSFTVVTGHEDPSAVDGTVNWEAIAKVGGTIVILMGVGRIARIVERLIAGGLDPATPAASVTWGTRPEQRTIRSTLAALPDEPLAAPATIVVGAVAGLDLAWFERRPLLGRRIVVTRTAEQSPALVDALRLAGAEPIAVPVIEIVEPGDDGAALDEALRQLGDGVYEWLVVTSPNGARRVLAGLPDARSVRAKVAAIGPGTAAAMAEGNVVADVVPDEAIAEALLAALPDPSADAPAGGGRVLLARAEVARDVLPVGLEQRGWSVDVAAAYRTVAVERDDAELERTRDAIASADTITFTSSSTVDRFVDTFGVDAVPPAVACIGPITAATARQHGITVDVEADEHTIDGLVAALVADAAGRP
jgi:uroporphyrinogen III methyltransferase/synthase